MPFIILRRHFRRLSTQNTMSDKQWLGNLAKAVTTNDSGLSLVSRIICHVHRWLVYLHLKRRHGNEDQQTDGENTAFSKKDKDADWLIDGHAPNGDVERVKYIHIERMVDHASLIEDILYTFTYSHPHTPTHIHSNKHARA